MTCGNAASGSPCFSRRDWYEVGSGDTIRARCEFHAVAPIARVPIDVWRLSSTCAADLCLFSPGTPMLKALELFGFKSFADKTRFEFPPGITVVVGPNGSGKSNIVDGIKWVLGEQRARSLRGKEMADVIFKGSGNTAGARKPANAAEVSICFDNSTKLLALDSEEVKVTRRVYRSGESEYLLNGSPCRLRDVKDLFRGTGMGTDAYSLIEQGKVDTLLQASPRDRRAIFEEAAGISRFKAKKVETKRRLDRVEQNLERLSDIVDEVEKQLRSVRNQASKARRYKEFNDRLKQLRTHVGLADWRRLSQALTTATERLAEVNEQASEARIAVAEHEAAMASTQQETDRLEQEVRDADSAAAQVRQQIASVESTRSYEYQRLEEQTHEITRFRRQWRSMTSRADNLSTQLKQLQAEVDEATAKDAEIRQRLEAEQQALSACQAKLNEGEQRRAEQRAEHEHQMRISADLERRIGILDSEISSSTTQIEQLQQRLDSIHAQCQELEHDLAQHQTNERELELQEDAARDALRDARDGLNANERELNELQQRAVDHQKRFAAASERANVLQDLERRNEGLNPGVRDLLKQAEDRPLGALASVRGVVADLIRVDVRMAPMIDTALGELTQYVVVEGPALVEQIAHGELNLSGRVGIIDCTTQGSLPRRNLRLENDHAVLGRADRFVETDECFTNLVEQLLANTWCVESFADALRLQSSTAYAEDAPRFVARDGALLDTQGRVLAGPRQAAVGLVSRRSELRSLQLELAELKPKMEQVDERMERLRERIAASEHQVHQRTTDYEAISSELNQARMNGRSISERLSSLNEQKEQLEADLQRESHRNDVARQQQLQQTERLDEVTSLVVQLSETIEELIESYTSLDEQRHERAEQVTSIKVELGKSEQTLDHLRGQLVRCEQDQRERDRAVNETRAQWKTAEERKRSAERALLAASSEQAELYLLAEFHDRQIARAAEKRVKHMAAHRNQSQALANHRKQLATLEETRHQMELLANQSQLERDALVQRVRDDYQINLSEIDETDLVLPDGDESQAEAQSRDEIDAEINELRRKLSNIGAVNMAALEEIESLEQRHTNLAGQYQDLVDAKDALVRIIQKINVDSRRLFTESLTTIRANFKALFRRVFGGGDADIVLEEGLDILEAGIDIVATPPGKQSLNISLLSGGERALTAVTLLLAIFQYRPSPFCVLDEVDGPLDEANIGRFVDVLNEFLQWTKFVVVTHSKKTMTAANTLYGVTMQESGISKRVSVKFEDVSEDGHINPEALQRDSAPPTQASDASSFEPETPSDSDDEAA